MGLIFRLFVPPFSIFLIAFLIAYPFHSGYHPIIRFLVAFALIYFTGALHMFG